MKNLIYLFSFILFFACSSEESEIISEESSPNPVYLDVNGITIKAREWADIGVTGDINGITYTVVDETMLREMVANNEDVTKVATTRVFNTSSLLDFDFNKAIGNWDMSNVTNTKGMFANNSTFNQDISDWDVSRVEIMGGMFYRCGSINQDLSLWDVTQVNHCDSFDYNTPQWTQPKPIFINCNL